MGDKEPILIHNLEPSNDYILLKNIEHKNHYDFTQLHRHNYFEIMFFQQGGGENLIDFIKYDVKANGCYIIYPGQIHLLKRSPGSSGCLIQFQQTSIISSQLQHLLQQRVWSGKGAVLFEEDEALMSKAMTIINAIEIYSNSTSAYRKASKQHLLQALIFDLCSIENKEGAMQSMELEFYQFQQLIEKHFKEEQTVAFYLEQLATTEKKLAALSKKHFGASPLQVIHRRVLLEAKRLLSFKDRSHKEIAYDLGFDSPASFSAFIKRKTGLTASEIQSEMSEIHN